MSNCWKVSHEWLEVGIDDCTKGGPFMKQNLMNQSSPVCARAQLLVWCLRVTFPCVPTDLLLSQRPCPRSRSLLRERRTEHITSSEPKEAHRQRWRFQSWRLHCSLQRFTSDFNSSGLHLRDRARLGSLPDLGVRFFVREISSKLGVRWFEPMVRCF